MNTVLSTPVDEQKNHHPPSPTTSVARRVTLPDRVALHLGLALITWSRRPRRAPSPEREYNPHELRERASARAKREEQWARAMYVSRPWR